MITLNDYLYSGDTVLKILKKYTEDLRQSAAQTGNEVDVRHCEFLSQIMELLEHNDFLTAQSQKIREFYKYMAREYPYLSFTFKGRIKSLIRAEAKFNGYVVEYIYDYYTKNGTYPPVPELQERLNCFRDLIAYRIVISMPKCHLKNPDDGEREEIRYLYETANVLKGFLEERGFTAESAGGVKESDSPLLSDAVRPYYRDYIAHVDPDGYPLGKWLIKTRQQKLNGNLKEERIAQLDEIGMVWNIFDAKWEKAYALAAAYYEENGNLNIPRSYVTAAGERLGQWVASQQWAYPKGKLTGEQVERLNRIGMYWGNRNDRQWNEGYQEAKRYFDAHGDLNIPAEYVSPNGYNLGNWVKRQRYTRHNPEKSCAVLTEERIAKLDEIGMRWEKADSRPRRLELAQGPHRESEKLNVSANHKTGEEIGLCS